MSEKLKRQFEADMKKASKDKPERRVVTLKLELKKRSEFRGAPGEGETRADDDEPIIAGHAAVFNQSADLGYFTERVAPGTFTKTIADDDIRALWNHDPNFPLARNRAGTLKLSQDDIGLAFEITPDATRSYDQDIMRSIARGDVSQCSIGFIVRSYEIERDGDDWTRTLTDVQLFDVSPVTYPAYTSTDVSIRSLADVLEEFRRGPDNPKSGGLTWEQDLDLRRRMLATLRD